MAKMNAGKIKKNVNGRSCVNKEDLIKNLNSENHRLEELLFHQNKMRNGCSTENLIKFYGRAVVTRNTKGINICQKKGFVRKCI